MSFVTFVLLNILSVTKASYNCANPIDFDKSNFVHKEVVITDFKLKESDSKKPFHKMLFDVATLLNPDDPNSDRKLTIYDGEDIVIRRLFGANNIIVSWLQKEIDFSKVMCDMKPEETYNLLSNCK